MKPRVFDGRLVDATNYRLPISSLRFVGSRLFSDFADEMSLEMSLVASVFRVRCGGQATHASQGIPLQPDGPRERSLGAVEAVTEFQDPVAPSYRFLVLLQRNRRVHAKKMSCPEPRRDLHHRIQLRERILISPSVVQELTFREAEAFDQIPNSLTPAEHKT
jgi:hypothetical protein